MVKVSLILPNDQSPPASHEPMDQREPPHPLVFVACGDLSILEIDALHAVRDTCQHLVGNGVKCIAEHRDGQVIAEDFDHVAFMAGNVRHVNHGHVHADVSHILCLLAIDQAVAMTIAQPTVQSIGITNGYSTYEAVAVKHCTTAVANRVARLHMAKLQDGGLERADAFQQGVIAAIGLYSIQADAEAAHVELPFREMLDTGRVVNVPEYLVTESVLQASAFLIEQLELASGELVEVVAVGTNEMRENGTGNHGLLPMQTVNELTNLVGIEP